MTFLTDLASLSVAKLLLCDPPSLFRTILACFERFLDAPKCSPIHLQSIFSTFESFRQCQAKLSSLFGPIQGLHPFGAYSLHLPVPLSLQVLYIAPPDLRP